ncbi:MAG TPA: hypothetical protein VHA82_03995 [Ramlibacter sp.]|uniref:hypothetical protein n=1 Tax=Ramlibacter sp. TaxID=1917967 RepID=UPI002BB5174B|nr:hypothetical protein [Ramlibacter sp.]HVZ42951.1 hypothetical protein [Ramlibacter sp.]
MAGTSHKITTGEAVHELFASEPTRPYVFGEESVHLDRGRLDKAMAAPHVCLPENANTPEEICAFLDAASRALK